jgi:hypothetical protein
MQGSEFDEAGFFRAIVDSGARALLIGRRALVVLGIPVLTADYDFWIHIDDISAFNAAAEPHGLLPSRTAEAARGSGRYVLENDERVDVLVARAVPTVDGVRVAFDEVWARRRGFDVAPGVTLAMPSIEDLILTKRFGGRPKDMEDIGEPVAHPLVPTAIPDARGAPGLCPPRLPALAGGRTPLVGLVHRPQGAGTPSSCSTRLAPYTLSRPCSSPAPCTSTARLRAGS